MEHNHHAMQPAFSSEYQICVGAAGSYGVIGRSGVRLVSLYPADGKMLVKLRGRRV